MTLRTTTNPEPREVRDPNAKQLVSTNRRARFEYEIMETLEAGIVLVGTEVKSLRAGRVNLQDAYCRVEHGEVWLYNMHISPYEQGNRYNEEPLRRRKLLMHHKEILLMQASMEQKGLALIPLSLYFRRGFAKLNIALGKGKKLYDKRQSIAERDSDREARRAAVGRD